MNKLINCVRLTRRLGGAPKIKDLENDKKVAKISFKYYSYITPAFS